ncbi:hypothetical protein EVAR_37060_1 [Eumeta japonica]|uniref:Uncharacterized protein n=1 Tax=Eumeta variegata TaxID=151549 RepID=A0A4C1WIQ0_EUMVA|nr:hypothetical protein EVAR_37060_1 [Eumeta japonica]
MSVNRTVAAAGKNATRSRRAAAPTAAAPRPPWLLKRNVIAGLSGANDFTCSSRHEARARMGFKLKTHRSIHSLRSVFVPGALSRGNTLDHSTITDQLR